MKLFNIIKRCIKSPKWRFNYLSALGFYKNDLTYIRKKFIFEVGYIPNLNEPKTFNEKLQWMKLNDRNPIYNTMVDKYAARNYISGIIGAQYLVPLLGVWDSPETIDFESLPNQFVLKCNHNSGTGMFICRNKNEMPIEQVKRNLRIGLKEDFYLKCREWPYKDVPRKIIAEQFLGENLTDYRFYCFNGLPQYVYVYQNDSMEGTQKPEPTRCNIVDMDWEQAPFHQKSMPSNVIPEKPEKFDVMQTFAAKLAAGFAFLRVDFYCVEGKIYVGELTLYPGGGFSPFYPKEWDRKLGDMLAIPQK